MFKTDKIYLQKWWDIPVEYHATNTGKILINIPGADGSVNGYKNKYINLGNYLQEKDIVSYVRIPNDRPQEFVSTGRSVINYCIEHSKEICGSDTPEIWLMGFSAGGASILLTGWEYPEVTKILAINPFIGIEQVKVDLKKNLPEYSGELYVVIGADDTVIGSDTGEYIKECAINTKDFQIYTIPNCDHQLKGETNSKILSQLPEYYFLGRYKEEKFPDGTKGFNLLDI